PLGVVEIILDPRHLRDRDGAPGDSELPEPAEPVDDLLPGHSGARPGVVLDGMALADSAGGEPIVDVPELAVVVRLRANEVDPGRNVLRLGQERPPARCIAANALEDRVGIAAEPDRDMRLLDRFRLER